MDLEKVVREHDADIMILHTMVDALLATHPHPDVVLARFQVGIDALAKSAPDDVDPEQIVELLARAQQNLIVWRKTTSATE